VKGEKLLKEKKNKQAKLIFLRRVSQLVFLFLFALLFIKTDYNGSDSLDSAVNILFRLNPFLAACVTVGAKTLIVLFWPALVVLLLTLLFGRFFCGWFCPMGTLFDCGRRVLPVKKTGGGTFFPSLPLFLFLFCLFAAFSGWGIAGYLDPFSILVRGLAQAIYPWFNSLTVAFFSFTYSELPEASQVLTEPVYQLMQATVLPSDQKVFTLPYLSLALLILPLLGECIQPRLFCRNICPLGGMLHLFARKSVLTGIGGDDSCGKCHLCGTSCRMGAIDDERSISMGNCNLCFECVEKCPKQIIDFAPRGVPRVQPVSIPRRQFVGALVGGLLLPSFKAVDVSSRHRDSYLIRPPGALAEDAFKSRCVRCAECIQVCVGNVLQPAFLQGGIDGVFSPVVVARTGYCEFNCTLCGQVCPTDAIRTLTKKEKQAMKIGHAWFDTDLCLPYAKGIPCMVCEEHCPTPEKAIRFREAMVTDSRGRKVRVKQPYLVDEFCIGCGICENKCPLPGKAAIYITRDGEHRHPTESLPDNSQTEGGY
jgi:ferredoxin